MNIMEIVSEMKEVINEDTEALKIIEVKPVIQSE